MSENVPGGIFRDMMAPTTDLQSALKSGDRAYGMLIRILEYLKTEVSHEGAGGGLSASEFLNKIIGLAHEYDLPEIREMALGYQEAGR
jgi:hypothetical protein